MTEQPKKKILIVEDERDIAEIIEYNVVKNGYEADIAGDGEKGLALALTGKYDLILLDVMLPKMNGLEVAAALRKEKIDTPILMLTAKDQIADKVSGLDAGADDYMTKPFSPEELTARIRALTRRQGEVILDEITFGSVKLSLSSCDLSRGEKSVHLNFKEFEIMKILMSNPSSVTTKDDLIVKVWGYDSNAVDNNVEVYVSFLRKKLDFIEADIEIVSLRKIGYRLEEKTDDKEG